MTPRASGPAQSRLFYFIDHGSCVDLIECPPGASIATIAAIHVQRVRIESFVSFQKPSTFLH
jgi:hypothetical protein